MAIEKILYQKTRERHQIKLEIKLEIMHGIIFKPKARERHQIKHKKDTRKA
jgi:hypothetical protein